jgi:hypothetical protein
MRNRRKRVVVELDVAAYVGTDVTIVTGCDRLCAANIRIEPLGVFGDIRRSISLWRGKAGR